VGFYGDKTMVETISGRVLGEDIDIVDKLSGQKPLVYTLVRLLPNFNTQEQYYEQHIRELEKGLMRFNATVMLKGLPAKDRYEPQIHLDRKNLYLNRYFCFNNSREKIEELTGALFKIIGHAPNAHVDMVIHTAPDYRLIEPHIQDMIRMMLSEELKLRDDLIYRLHDEKVVVIDHNKIVEARK